jgi:hypothetical protein
MNTTLSPAAAYVDAVRSALADLPADDLAEIVDDVRDHVEQVAAERGEDPSPAQLEERLGTPAAYAAELRSAAGYPPRPGAATGSRASSRLPRGLATLECSHRRRAERGRPAGGVRHGTLRRGTVPGIHGLAGGGARRARLVRG